METWQPPAELDTVDIKVLELALSQTDARQKDLEATLSNITARVQTLLTLLTGVVIAAFGFLITHLNNGPALALTGLFGICYALAVCIYLLHYAYTGQYIPAGGTPSSVIQPPLFSGGLDDKARSLYIILLYGADKRLKANHNENERRWRVLSRATLASVFMPIALIVTYVLLCWLGPRIGSFFLD